MQPDENTIEESCSVKIPSWVIYFLILLLVISVFGFVYFHKYTKSVHEYKLAITKFEENDLEAAEKYITSASDLIPNNNDFLSLKYYISGLKKYTEQNYDESLDLLKKYLTYNRDDTFIDQIIKILEISMAFDEKDYNLMAERAAQAYSDYDTDPLFILRYASALACRYADKEDIEDFNKSKELIEVARTYELDDSDLDVINRIEYRLKTKKIITSDEYHQLEKEGKL